jgi:hypothetical protein
MTQSLNALPIITEGQLRRCNQRGLQSEMFASALETDEDLRSCAERVRACYRSLEPMWIPYREEYILRPVYGCGVALCPSCLGRHSRPRRKYIKALTQLMADHPGYMTVFATFTIRSIPAAKLKVGITDLHKSFAKLLRRKPLKQLVGYLRATEFNVGANGAVHHHLHALFLLPPGTDLGSLTAIWQKAAGTDYVPSVDWEPLFTAADVIRKGTYMNKSPMKLTEEILSTPLLTQQLFRQLRGCRLFSAGGALKHLKATCSNNATRSSESSLSSSVRFEWSPAGGYEHRC